MALHLTLASCNQIVRKFGIDHVVFCLEGRSWRKDFYEPYKKNRIVDTQSQTEAEKEENELFWKTYEQFVNFLREKTNVSVLRDPNAEADDLIARWVALHPEAENFIISSDTDFIQLITEKTKIYNGITNQLITLEGYFDDKGRIVKDKKTGEPKLLGDPQFILFQKCMRGDSTDNVFSAYPGVRSKGTKNKVGLEEAFADMGKKGFNWNNMMLQRWADPEGAEHRVLDDYERNVHLVDLTAQPEEIKTAVDGAIREQMSHKDIGQVGVRFMQFCGKYELTKCSESADSFGQWMNETYQGVLNG